MLRHLAKAAWKPQGVGLRWCASVTEGENKLMGILKQKLEADPVVVKDVSGGCGAMYQILVVSSKFEGVKLVQQHKMVNDALQEEIGNMHGLTIKTMSPKAWAKLAAANE